MELNAPPSANEQKCLIIIQEGGGAGGPFNYRHVSPFTCSCDLDLCDGNQG